MAPLPWHVPAEDLCGRLIVVGGDPRQRHSHWSGSLPSQGLEKSTLPEPHASRSTKSSGRKAESRALLHHPLSVAAGVTALSTFVSYVLPADLQVLGVASTFLLATYLTVVRGDDTQKIRHHGVSLGGLVDPERLDLRRLLREAMQALGWALLPALLLFPPFSVGFVVWWQPSSPFVHTLPSHFADQALGQLLLVALPEEAFYRGYLQTTLDDRLGARWRLGGAQVGPGVLVTSAIFAVGHLATELNPSRLAVFFPALVFGWLRAKTGGIGAPLVFHAFCNLFAAYLLSSYGLA